MTGQMAWDGNVEDKKKERHKKQMSIRKESWLEQSNMTMEEILKFSFWWSQAQIDHQLGLFSRTGVDWDSFCREVRR